MPISEIYKMPIVRQDNFRLYKEAIGMITEDEKAREQQDIIMRCQENCDPNDLIIENILSTDQPQYQPVQPYHPSTPYNPALQQSAQGYKIPSNP